MFFILITSCDDDTCYGWLAAYHIYTWSLLVCEWHATDSSLSLLLDLCLGLGCTVPMAEEETTVLHTLLELLVVVALVNVSITVSTSLLEDILLDVFQHILYALYDAVEANVLLLQCITTHDFDGVVLQVTSTHSQTDRNTLQLVVSKLEARTLSCIVIIFHSDAELTELVDDWLQLGCNLSQLLVALVDRDDNHLDRSQLWRQYETVVIAAKKMMLECPDYSNDIISAECGFSCRTHLYRIFKTKEGCSPTEWRDFHSTNAAQNDSN